MVRLALQGCVMGRLQQERSSRKQGVMGVACAGYECCLACVGCGRAGAARAEVHYERVDCAEPVAAAAGQRAAHHEPGEGCCFLCLLLVFSSAMLCDA
jgi:hypothetical protein